MLFTSHWKLFSFSRYLNFWLHFLEIQKNSLIRNIRLIPKFIISQPDSQTSTIHILLNISQSKGNQTMKLTSQQNITREIFFFKIHAKNEVGRLVPDLFLFLKKLYMKVKASNLQLSSNIFRQRSTWHTIKTNCLKL